MKKQALLSTFLARSIVVGFWGITIIAAVALVTRFRTIPYVFLAVAIATWWRWPLVRRASVACLVLAGFLGIQFMLPLDVSIMGGPGGPRVVPLLMGLPAPSEELAAKVERGEVALGGCVVAGNEPRWILVW